MLHFLFCRGDRIRTCDPLVPNQVRYQLRHAPKTVSANITKILYLYFIISPVYDITFALLSGRQDSNLRPPGPKPGALPIAPRPENFKHIRTSLFLTSVQI